MSNFRHSLPLTRRLLEHEFRNGSPGGAQIHITLGGEVVAEGALGEARPGAPMQIDTILPWRSAGKPITALCVAQLVETGQVSLDLPVATYLPEFGQLGKETVTVGNLLTHTGGFRTADRIPEPFCWDETLARIYGTPLEPGWIPGKTAGYHMTSSWFVLGEIVQRLTGEPFTQYVRKKIFEPLNIPEARFSFSSHEIEKLGEKLGWMHGQPASNPTLNAPESLSRCRPGSSARGSIRDLARLYQFLLNPDSSILKPETIRDFTARHRIGLFDRTFQHIVDFGFGFVLDSNRYGRESVPYGYGRHCSEATFGHSGAQSSCAFADPKHQLVVAWVLTALVGERSHQKRAREINSAIYEDLGLSSP